MFYKQYVSNTLAGSANQSFFESDNTLLTGRVYYKLFADAKEHALLFGDTADSTFADGDYSRCNMTSGKWEIVSLKAGIVPSCGMESPTTPETFVSVTFSGNTGKCVAQGEQFYTDSFYLDAKKGEFLCLEIAFKGEKIPCHPELWIASFRKEADKFVPSVHLPVPSMVGCVRAVEKRIGFLGDSITQGIGSEKNSYGHWTAVVAEKLGTQNAYWNLGIGFARASDAATDGAWLQKVKQNDAVVVCLGVNDSGRIPSAEPLKESLQKIVDILKAEGIKVIIQTVPPFDYAEPRCTIWNDTNQFIQNSLALKTDGYFDNRPILSLSAEQPQRAKYGGHPNNEGCYAWADALYAYLKDVL